jgi:hypothetical protein
MENSYFLQGNPEAKPAKMLPDCPTTECARNVYGLDFYIKPRHYWTDPAIIFF